MFVLLRVSKAPFIRFVFSCEPPKEESLFRRLVLLFLTFFVCCKHRIALAESNSSCFLFVKLIDVNSFDSIRLPFFPLPTIALTVDMSDFRLLCWSSTVSLTSSSAFSADCSDWNSSICAISSQKRLRAPLYQLRYVPQPSRRCPFAP